MELEYKNLTITVWTLTSPAVYYPNDFAHPDEYDDFETEIDWYYWAEDEEVMDFLHEKLSALDEYKDKSDEELNEYINDHYEDLCDEYYKDLLDHFEDKAREDAEENYEPEPPEPDYDYDY